MSASKLAEVNTTPEERLAAARKEMGETRTAMVNVLVKQVAAVKYLKGKEAVPTIKVDKPLLQKMLESLDGLEDKVTLKPENAPRYNNVSEAKVALGFACRDFIDIFKDVIDTSVRVREAKSELGYSGSYIVPVVEQIVYKDIFEKLAEYLTFDEGKDGKGQVTRWYRHAIAASLKEQQPIGVYIINGDAAAKKAAEQYFPTYEIIEVEANKLASSIQLPSDVVFIDKESFANSYKHLGLFAGYNVFTPFAGFGPNKDVKESVVGIAAIQIGSLSEVDKKLNSERSVQGIGAIKQ
jgi:hypothetical protein